MRRLYCFLTVISLFSCESIESNYAQIAKTQDAIVIDGKGNEKSWSTTSWRTIDQKWIGEDYSETDFQGRYKILWDKDNLYVLAEIVDDKLIDTHEDGLDRYWDDDCLEIFVDADGSGGNHQYNYNAFAYHIALDGKVTDIGADSLPHYYDHVTSERVTNETMSVWEASIKIYDDNFVYGEQNKPLQLLSGQALGFAIAYCDNDHSEERENFIGSSVVEGEDKNRGWIDAGIFEGMVLE